MTLALETGTYATNPSIALSADRLSISFGDGVNPTCLVAHPEFGGVTCHKRAVRASAGIKRGEFRYYEAYRLIAPSNIGFGYTTANSAIDPYCCLVEPAEPIAPETPPSMSINTTAPGVFVQLRYTPMSFTESYSAEQTTHYGFAVDYTGANPVVYVVARDMAGAMVVLRRQTLGFNGADVIPFAYGHTGLAPAGTLVAGMNFGRSTFHYNLTALRSELALQGANVSAFTAGVGPQP